MDRKPNKPLSRLIMVYATVVPMDLAVLYMLDADLRLIVWSLLFMLMLLGGTVLYFHRVMMGKHAGEPPPFENATIGVESDAIRAEHTPHLPDNLHVVGTLAAGIAHEIRNPLTSLKGFLQLFREREPYYTKIMLSEVDRINDIVSELLELSSPKEETPELKRLYPMLQNVYTLLSAEAMLRDIQLKFRLAPNSEHFAVMCRERKLKQVFINVLKNAIEAVPSGGEICVSMTHSDGEAIIDIADNGEGIPEEIIERLGQPFITTKERGTGLGLMMCLQIINDHHGTMHFRNRESGGAIVTIKLPGFAEPTSYCNSSLNGRHHQ